MITYTNLIKNFMYFRNVYTHIHTNQTQRVPESKHMTNFSTNDKILIKILMLKLMYDRKQFNFIKDNL